MYRLLSHLLFETTQKVSVERYHNAYNIVYLRLLGGDPLLLMISSDSFYKPDTKTTTCGAKFFVNNFNWPWPSHMLKFKLYCLTNFVTDNQFIIFILCPDIPTKDEYKNIFFALQICVNRDFDNLFIPRLK